MSEDDELVAVPHVNDMEDDILIKHVNARHIDGPDNFTFRVPLERTSERVADVDRAVHDYFHRATPEEHDHYHLEES